MAGSFRITFKTATWCALLIAAWASAVVTASLLGYGGLGVKGTAANEFVAAVRDRAADHQGNLALVLIENRRIAATHSVSIGKPVNSKTLFQMASVSKMVTAWGVMNLVEDGKIDLDAPVSSYLKRWKLPLGEFDNRQVTARNLLSHTSGLGDGLGYCGFLPGERLQTLPESLAQASDACPLRTGKTKVANKSGSWRYSGGGFTLLQLLIEDVSGQPFADYMEREVLIPLGMTRSTFRTGASGANDVVDFYDSQGSVTPHRLYAASAAASLYSNASDLSRFALAHFPGPNGEPAGRGVIGPQVVAEMRKPQARIFGSPLWGLGTQLFAPAEGDDYIFGHNGGNIPAVSTTIRIDPRSGDAIVALSTGGNSIAAELGSEWTALRRSAVTLPMIYMAAQSKWQWIGLGWLMILLGGIVGAVRAVRRART